MEQYNVSHSPQVPHIHQLKCFFSKFFTDREQIFKFFNLIPVGLSIALDASCREIRHNPKAARFLRVDNWENQSCSIPEAEPIRVLRDGAELDAHQLPIQRAAWNREVVESEELEFIWEDGVRKYALWSACPIYDENMAVIGVIASCEDITACKNKEAKIHKEQEMLEQEMARLDRLDLVGEMAATIGHEVRNPMTTVRGYLQMFRRKELFAGYREQFDTMIEELDRANSIITEFLSLAKNKNVQLAPGNINDVIIAIFPLVQADAVRRGHQILVNLEHMPKLMLDGKEIRQLILNLVSNALEAMTTPGVVFIETYVNKGTAVLAIRDEGSGIPAEIMETLGTPFMTTKENGTGLGIPVCYRIAERHKAKIDIKSSAKGTTFFINFPIGSIKIA